MEADEIRSVQEKALTRFQEGQATYGEYGFLTRDTWQDLENELLDAMNYLAMLVLKLRRLESSR